MKSNLRTPRPSDYRAIKLWGDFLGSYTYYIKDQQHKACSESAPVDAVFKSHDSNEWVTIRDLNPEHPVRKLYE